MFITFMYESSIVDFSKEIKFYKAAYSYISLSTIHVLYYFYISESLVKTRNKRNLVVKGMDSLYHCVYFAQILS